MPGPNMDDIDHLYVTGMMRTEEEKRLVLRAAEHLDESISGFVRRAVLRRAVDVARSLDEPEPSEEERIHA